MRWIQQGLHQESRISRRSPAETDPFLTVPIVVHNLQGEIDSKGPSVNSAKIICLHVQMSCFRLRSRTKSNDTLQHRIKVSSKMEITHIFNRI